MDLIIFYVEDDEDDVAIFSELLLAIDPGIKCIHAKNGAVALQMLEKLIVQPHFIFFDVNMPIMDGREFLNQLRKNEDLKDVPLIAYTTSTSDSDKSMFRQLGVAEYLVKPNNYVDAVNGIARILKIQNK